MIKIYCNQCEKEITDFSFIFEAVVREVIKAGVLVGGNPQPQNRLEEKKIHLCKDCYNKKFNK